MQINYRYYKYLIKLKLIRYHKFIIFSIHLTFLIFSCGGFTYFKLNIERLYFNCFSSNIKFWYLSSISDM